MFKKGYRQTKEHKQKLSEVHKGIKCSERAKQKLSIHQKKMGIIPPPRKGISHTIKTRRRISNNLKGRFVGEKNHNWRGGISFEPYGIDWTKTLKRSIRERDRYTCQICGVEPAVFVHHIDYNKKNCNPDNLITLCNSCHSQTNQNRKYWIKYFTDWRK